MLVAGGEAVVAILLLLLLVGVSPGGCEQVQAALDRPADAAGDRRGGGGLVGNHVECLVWGVAFVAVGTVAESGMILSSPGV